MNFLPIEPDKEKYKLFWIHFSINKFVVLYEAESKSSGIIDNKQTFAKYANYVIDIKERVEKKKHMTIVRYKSLLARINIAIGHIKLADLRPQHLNKFYEMLSQNGTNLKTGEGLSSKTIIEHHRLIHTILKQAEKNYLLNIMPRQRRLPRNIKERKLDLLR